MQGGGDFSRSTFDPLGKALALEQAVSIVKPSCDVLYGKVTPQGVRSIQPRIIKGTLRSAKRKQIGSDRLRMVLHLSKDSGQGTGQFRGGREVPVVSSGLARVLPEPLGGIELR